MTPTSPPDPPWFTHLAWSTPLAVETLWRGGPNRNVAPAAPGVYAFTLFGGPITLAMKLGVLYIGKAGSLRSRTKSYLIDPARLDTVGRTGRQNTSLNHAGKVGVLVAVAQRSRGTAPSGIFLRWAVTASEGDARRNELLLLDYFQPGLNTQDVQPARRLRATGD
jgi:hypothetical protein